MTRLKTVIVGCGNIAGGYDAGVTTPTWPLTHAAAYGQHGGFELTACCDPDTDRREAFQHRWNIPIGVDDPAHLPAALRRVDVVSLCAPTTFHHQHLLEVLTWSPRLVFCEKPLAASLEDAENALATYEAAGVPLAVNYTRRWDPEVLQLRLALQQGHWGAVRSVSATYNKGVLNNGGHLIDLLHLLFGEVKVLAAGPATYDHWPEDPSVPALLEVGTRIPVTLNIANAADYALFEMQIVTERGVLAMEAGGLNWSWREVADSTDFPGYRVLHPAVTRPGRYREAMAAAVDNLYRTVSVGDPLSSTAQSALRTHRICDQLLRLASTPQLTKGNSHE